MSKIELIIDTIDKKGDDILFLHPEHMNGAKFCASNTFDKATINNCPTEKLSSGNLIGIYNTLKPGAEISVTVFQPIAIMLPYDSKQIEANLQLVGFENIEINEKYVSVKKGVPSTTIVVVTATKPVGKGKQDYENEKKNDKNIEKIIEKKENKYFEEKKPKKIVFRVERAAYFALRSRVKKEKQETIESIYNVDDEVELNDSDEEKISSKKNNEEPKIDHEDLENSINSDEKNFDEKNLEEKLNNDLPPKNENEDIPISELTQKNVNIGLHFHKDKNGKVYKYFVHGLIGENGRIFHCSDESCRGTAKYDVSNMEFKVMKEHTKKYEDHYYVIDLKSEKDNKIFCALADNEKYNECQIFRKDGKRYVKYYKMNN